MSLNCEFDETRALLVTQETFFKEEAELQRGVLYLGKLLYFSSLNICLSCQEIYVLFHAEVTTLCAF